MFETLLSAAARLLILLIPKDIKSLGIKLFGLSSEGAAIATVVAYFIGFVYLRVLAYKKSGIGKSTIVVKHLFAALVTGAIVYYVKTFYYIARWYDLLAIFFMGMLIYVGILATIRQFRKEDFYLFVETLNPKKMMQGICTVGSDYPITCNKDASTLKTDNITVYLTNSYTEPITVTGGSFKTASGNSGSCNGFSSVTINEGDTGSIMCDFGSGILTTGNKEKITLTLNYYVAGYSGAVKTMEITYIGTVEQ